MDSNPISSGVFYGRRYKNLQSALEDLNKESADIVIIPPNPDYQTDVDEIDEDEIQAETLPTDVPGEIEVFAEEEESDDEDNVPLAELQTKIKKQKIEEQEPKWTTRLIDINLKHTNGSQDRQNHVKAILKDLQPVQVFEKLFDEDVIKYLTEETNRYAQQNNNHNFIVHENEIRSFIGILLFSGYHQLPRERLYWCLDEDLNVPLIANCMSRNRYNEIKKYFHLCNNEEIDRTDKMTKLRPLMKKLNKNFTQWGIFHEKLSIDEAMVKYYGHHSSKQFIRGKPVRFGYKDWMICSSSGYCYQFDTYCGAKGGQKTHKMPLGSRVVLELLEVVSTPSDHVVFFDNYFSSHFLLKQLRDMGYRASGTVRDNRIKKCPLPSKSEGRKIERGYFAFQYDEQNSLLLVRWQDNNFVTMITNYDSIEPLGKVKRWSKEQKAKIDVPQPHLFAEYNEGMGGVDLLDQAVNNYRISIQGKKWWWPLWTHMLNVALVNAWRLHSLTNNSQKMDLLNFLRHVSRHYLRNFEKHSYQKKTRNIPQSLVASEFGHFPQKLENQLRCRQCHRRVRWECRKCKVTLCLERECFVEFHS